MPNFPSGLKGGRSVLSKVIGPSRPSDASRVVGRILLAVLALLGLFVPTNGVSRAWYPVVMGLPLLWGAVRYRGERQFRTWAAYILGFVAFTILRVYADDLGVTVQFAYPIVIDRFVGLGVLPTLRLQHAFYHYRHAGWLDDVTLAVYLSYFVTPPVVAVALWLRRPALLRRYVVALLTLFGTSLACHVTVPTAPPWLAAIYGYTPHVSRIVYDIIYGISPRFYQFGYHVAGGNDVAAMPSLHMATACLIAATGWHTHRGLRILGVVYAIIMGFSLVYLGEHYVADIAVGAVLAVFCWQWPWLMRLATGAPGCGHGRWGSPRSHSTVGRTEINSAALQPSGPTSRRVSL